MESKTGSYEDLEVYRRAFGLLRPVEDLARSLPEIERRLLADQIRRASRSVTANIVEGWGRRRSAREFCSYRAVAVGSVNEMEVHLKTGREFGYGHDGECQLLLDEYRIVGKQLTRLIQFWQRRAADPG